MLDAKPESAECSGQFRKAALVVEGAALRSVFAAGLLDGFIRCGFQPFNAVVGVSGGAINLACYLSRRADLAADIFNHVAATSVLPARILSRGNLSVFQIIQSLGLRAEDFNLPEDVSFHTVATDVETGSPVYIEVGKNNLFQSVAASSSIPSVAAPVDVNGRKLVDGGVSDPVPVKRVVEQGFSDVMVIRARPSGYKRSDTWKHKIMRARMRKYPSLVATMRSRIERHAAVDKLIQNPPKKVRIQSVCPPDSFSMRPFSASVSELVDGYLYGLNASGGVIDDWKKNHGGG